MDDFRAPHSIPQDLLLIQELIGDSFQSSQVAHTPQNEDISSSSESDNGSAASEDEIERELMTKTEGGLESSDGASPSASSSSSDDSDSEEEETSEPSPRAASDTAKAAAANEEPDDDDEGAPAQSNSYMQTKNEVVDLPITIPDVEEVGHEVAIEKVGEIMSIVGNVVIIKGLPSEVANRGLDKALDSDTLLVFDDRKVLGYIYETFGPTSQPLYQIRFNDTFPLDPEKVRVSREVFHVPQKSNYVFIREIKKFKGSDASNFHDEEPADDELEFSDDEMEAAHRLHMKRKRSASRASSQQPAPSSSQPYEQPDYTGIAFDAYGPYDARYGTAPPPRPLPMPYEDPYSDEYNGTSPEITAQISEDRGRSETTFPRSVSKIPERGRGAPRHRRGETRGRGRGRGRGWRPNPAQPPQPVFTKAESIEPYSPHDPGFIPSGSFARAPSGGGPIPPYASMWQGFSQAQPFNIGSGGYQNQAVVQPHINPRFAPAFGLNLYPSPYTQFPQQSQVGQSDQTAWANDWGLHMDGPPTSNRGSNPNTNDTA